MQFVLDRQFLVEVARCGGYLSDDIMRASLEAVSHAETGFASAGLNPRRHIKDERWAVNAASKALQKLQELEIKAALKPDVGKYEEKMSEPGLQYFGNSSENEDATGSSEDFGHPDSANIESSESSDDRRRQISKEDFPVGEDADVKWSTAGCSDPDKETRTVEDDRDENYSRTRENILQEPHLTGDNLG